MTAKYLVVNNNKVDDVIIADASFIPIIAPYNQYILLAANYPWDVTFDWIYDSGADTFSAPPPPEVDPDQPPPDDPPPSDP